MVPKNMYLNIKHCRTVVETIAKYYLLIINCRSIVKVAIIREAMEGEETER